MTLEEWENSEEMWRVQANELALRPDGYLRWPEWQERESKRARQRKFGKLWVETGNPGLFK